MTEEELKERGFVPAVTIYVNDQAQYKVIAPPGVYAAKMMARAVFDFLEEMQRLVENDRTEDL